MVDYIIPSVIDPITSERIVMRSSNTHLDEEGPNCRGGNQPWLHSARGTVPLAVIAQLFAAITDAYETFLNHGPAYELWPRTTRDTAPVAMVAQQFAATSDVSISFPSFTTSEMQRLAGLWATNQDPLMGFCKYGLTKYICSPAVAVRLIVVAKTTLALPCNFGYG
ncbi:hypothetical protein RJ639_012549 [Escallonia herrerae]|uniref:Uncharacterized protein n=1 Tax=Escallonia herrerae TaxID=1293975 RepID=A0AA88VN92_9ASTE|nr:hypothetical protein RJ639_012549 [Escallonia herrerae]